MTALKNFIPEFILSWYHLALAFSGAVVYSFPSRRLKVIGVTGTKGKTTAVCITAKILEQAGYKVAAFSSLSFKIGDKEEPNLLKLTMPGRWQLQKMLAQAVGAGCQYALLEVTSEGIKQYRHKFINFDVAVFTNLAPEHIEAHGSFEKYRQAKAELFKATKDVHVINLDDQNAEYFLGVKAREKWFYTKISNHKFQITNKFKITNYKFKTIKAEKVNADSDSIQFTVQGLEFKVGLMGEFNISNALAAISVGVSQGIKLETIRQALDKIKGVPGRMEEVISEPFQVVVDYAHTPDSLEAVYKAAKLQITNHKLQTNYKSQITNPKLICVLGSAGGGRDRWKRPVLGEIAARHCSQIILTNEDPYDENPLTILEQIESGFSQIPNSKSQIPNYRKIIDRREAINFALSLVKPGDTVIITGKGAEPWIMGSGGSKTPWDDRKVVKEEFQKLYPRKSAQSA